MRSISFAITTRQILDRSKDVTRRLGWANATAGQYLQGVEKGMGLKKGEKAKKLEVIHLVSVRREPLDAMIYDPAYGKEEARREGFPEMSGAEFVAMFCETHKGCTPETMITRLEFEYAEGVAK